MVAVSSLFTFDVYRRYIKPEVNFLPAAVVSVDLSRPLSHQYMIDCTAANTLVTLLPTWTDKLPYCLSIVCMTIGQHMRGHAVIDTNSP